MIFHTILALRSCIFAVEKAAAVFSLKLDNGHKLLCPWIDNACDESLASFPPSSPQVLVEGFKERFHALLQLTTLPVISSLTVDCMNSPQLDRLLSTPFHPSVSLNNGIRLIEDCRSKELYDTSEDGDSHGYYQVCVLKGIWIICIKMVFVRCDFFFFTSRICELGNDL